MPADELAEYEAARRDAAVAGAMLAESESACRRMAAQLVAARAEIDYLRGFLTKDAATSGPFHVWIAGYGDRRFVGYRRGDRFFVPGVCVVEDVDVLRTEAIA